LAFGGFEFAKSPLFPLIFILAVVFLFNPVRNRVQKFIDRVFYRLEYDYQETVRKIGETMRSLLNMDDICKTIMKFALEPMFVDAGSVMLLDRDKKDYECLIQSGKREDRKVETETETGTLEEKMEEEKQMSTETEDKGVNTSGLKLPVDDPLIQKIAE
jgi:hypothetical protein